MKNTITSAPASKSPLDAFEQALCANERHGTLIELIDDKLRYTLDQPHSTEREEELEKCWSLIWLARDNGIRLHVELSEACERMFAERRGEGAAA